MNTTDEPARATTATCARCNNPIAVAAKGRVPGYCSPRCRTAAWKTARQPSAQVKTRTTATIQRGTCGLCGKPDLLPCVKTRRGAIPTHCSAECAIEDPARYAEPNHQRIRIEGYASPSDYFQTALMRRTTCCILWPYATTGTHGHIRITGEYFVTSRLACWFRWGPPPSLERKWHAAHGPCVSTLCMNPAHVRWLSNSQNQDDRLRDGTDCFGEKNPNAKLTASSVRDIRAQRATGSLDVSRAAAQYGITPSYVSAIASGRNWQHIA